LLISEEENQLRCSECNNTKLHMDPENGELVCARCGTVVSEKQISMMPEWRAFNQVQRETLPRTGSPMTLTINDKGLSTSIGWRNTDYAGKRLNPETRNKLYRLRKWNRRSKITDSYNRNLSQALSMMTKLSNKLNLPRNVLETSSMIYRKALKTNLIRGRTIQCVVVASLYTACRQCHIVRSLTDVAEAANIPRKTAARNYRFLRQKLDIDVPRVQRTGYINRLVSQLGLYGQTEMLAMKILEEASKKNFTHGRSPAGIAAACVYVSSRITDEQLTQHQVACVAQVTEVTIRNRYKELVQKLDIEINV